MSNRAVTAYFGGSEDSVLVFVPTTWSPDFDQSGTRERVLGVVVGVVEELDVSPEQARLAYGHAIS